MYIYNIVFRFGILSIYIYIYIMVYSQLRRASQTTLIKKCLLKHVINYSERPS